MTIIKIVGTLQVEIHTSIKDRQMENQETELVLSLFKANLEIICSNRKKELFK